eukprot:scaffold113327_cov66-Phaeocystis_antarctica.AAC.4
MALTRRDASLRLSPRRVAERALCRCDRLLALGHVLEIVGHRLGVVLVAVAGRIIDVPVPRAAVLHIDVAVVLVDVRLDALILFELVADLVPDLGGFPPERLGRSTIGCSRPRAPCAQAGPPLPLLRIQHEAGVQRLVAPIPMQHVHALRHHRQCGDARLERVLRLLDVRSSIWLVEHALWDVGGDKEDVLEQVLVVLQVLGSSLQQRLVLQTFLVPRCVAFHSLLSHAAEDAIAHRVRNHVEAQRLLAVLQAGEELPEGASGDLRACLVYVVPLPQRIFWVGLASPVDGHNENSVPLFFIEVRLHRLGRCDHVIGFVVEAVDEEDHFLSFGFLGQQGGELRLRG